MKESFIFININSNTILCFFFSYLQKHRGGHLRAAELVELAVQAAQGLAFLHAASILHGDIAARNCV